MAEFDRAAAEAVLSLWPADEPPTEAGHALAYHLRAALAELDRERARKLDTYTADLELTLEVIAEALGGTTGPAGITHRAAELVAERDRLVAEVRRLREQVAGYRSRLEIDHVYRLGSEPGEMVREEVPEGRKIPDGIECRDETIRMQDEEIKSLSAEVRRLREELDIAMAGKENDLFLLYLRRLQEKVQSQPESGWTWYEMPCPKCKKHVLFYCGDTRDLTRPDVETVTCWACGGRIDLRDEPADDPGWSEESGPDPRAMQAETARLRALLSQLADAAGPVAVFLRGLDNVRPVVCFEDTDAVVVETDHKDPVLTIGDCRRLAAARDAARAVLEGKS